MESQRGSASASCKDGCGGCEGPVQPHTHTQCASTEGCAADTEPEPGGSGILDSGSTADHTGMKSETLNAGDPGAVCCSPNHPDRGLSPRLDAEDTTPRQDEGEDGVQNLDPQTENLTPSSPSSSSSPSHHTETNTTPCCSSNPTPPAQTLEMKQNEGEEFEASSDQGLSYGAAPAPGSSDQGLSYGPPPAPGSSDQGLSYGPAPAPGSSASLPGSVSCDPTRAQLDDDGCDDEAFEPQHHQNQSSGPYNGPVQPAWCGASRNTFRSVRRQSAPGELSQHQEPTEPGEPPDLQSRRPGIAEYLGDRGLFPRRQRTGSEGVAGWKLFGKVPPRESPTKDPHTIRQEYEERSTVDSTTQHAVGQSSRKKRLGFEPLSTTALILEDRPPNLPAKSLEEAQRHRQQYDEMVAEAKKRELKEAERRQRQIKDRLRQEENISNAMLVWEKHILPCWEDMRNSSTCRDLWWSGLPPSVRGRVWSLSISNELNITPDLYEIFVSRAKKWNLSERQENTQEDGESNIELIKLDISTTLPSLYIFQKGGPYHDLLQSILGAYLCYRPDVGYVQGMSFIAAVLILNMEPSDSFICFCNLLNKPCLVAFYRVNHDMMQRYMGAFEVFFQENLPRLFSHFQSLSLTPDLYLIEWVWSLYLRSLPLDVACRVWDLFCRDGEEFLFRTALGILRLKQNLLLDMDLIHIVQLLSRLPDEEQLSDRLFSCIAATPMLSGNRKWSQVLNRDAENS